MNLPPYISRMKLFQILGLLGSIFHFHSNIGDPDQTPSPATSDLGLHCLPMSHKRTLGLYGFNQIIDIQAFIYMHVHVYIRARIRDFFYLSHC